MGESIRRVHDDACRSPLCLSCLREFRGLGHAVGSRFTLLESKGRAFCSISQRIAVRRRAVFSFPVTVCARARASSRKTRARWRTERLGRGFFRSSVRDKYVALNGARRKDDTSNETRTTGGARKDGKRSPPSSFWLSILYFLATSFDVAMRSRCRLFRSLFLLLSLHTNHLHPLSRVLFFRGHRVSGRALAYLLNACNALSFLIVSFQTTAKGAPTRFGRHNTSGERPTIARTPSCTHKCTVHSDAQVWARRGRAARIGAQAV